MPCHPFLNCFYFVFVHKKHYLHVFCQQQQQQLHLQAQTISYNISHHLLFFKMRLKKKVAFQVIFLLKIQLLNNNCTLAALEMAFLLASSIPAWMSSDTTLFNPSLIYCILLNVAIHKILENKVCSRPIPGKQLVNSFHSFYPI